MFGAALMRGQTLGRPVCSRDFDQYPETVQVDFRRLDESALKRYLVHFEIEHSPNAPHEKLAQIVAKHFQLEAILEPREENAVLRNFSNFIMTSTGGNVYEDPRNTRTASTKRVRKKTRRTANENSDNSDEEGQSADDTTPPPPSLSSRAARGSRGNASATAASSTVSREESAEGGEEEQESCFCRKYTGDTYIACDNAANCPFGEWFHVGCVGLKDVPDSDWLCPGCVKNAANNT